MKQKIDVLIAGAGFSGLVLAQKLSEIGYKCVIVEKRNHIGGNAWDTADKNGVLYHPYGPHYFRTNSSLVKSYLSRFTEWVPVKYKVNSWTHDKFWSFPVNLTTFEQYIGRAATEEEFAAWLKAEQVECEHPKNGEDVILSQAGRTFYKLFFKGYTEKQWNRSPRDLDASVTARIPVRTTRDDNYLREDFQALPREGYNQMFANMVKASPGLEILLETDFQEARGNYEARHIIYTGPVDAYFAYCHGRLPWRSLRFELESFTAEELLERETISGKQGYWQPVMQVNYPNDFDFTRIVEIKHATGQATPFTNVVREFPQDDAPGREPYYPVPAPDAREIYRKYKVMADAETGTSFVGRLATYHYYNMDQVTALALHEFERLTSVSGPLSLT